MEIVLVNRLSRHFHEKKCIDDRISHNLTKDNYYVSKSIVGWHHRSRFCRQEWQFFLQLLRIKIRGPYYDEHRMSQNFRLTHAASVKFRFSSSLHSMLVESLASSWSHVYITRNMKLWQLHLTWKTGRKRTFFLDKNIFFR